MENLRNESPADDSLRDVGVWRRRSKRSSQAPKAGERVGTRQLTEVGRALKDVGIEPIPAYSPQARGRSERNFGTWQGRLPQELRIRQIRTVDEANHFLCKATTSRSSMKVPVEFLYIGAINPPPLCSYHRHVLRR